MEKEIKLENPLLLRMLFIHEIQTSKIPNFPQPAYHNIFFDLTWSVGGTIQVDLKWGDASNDSNGYLIARDKWALKLS